MQNARRLDPAMLLLSYHFPGFAHHFAAIRCYNTLSAQGDILIDINLSE
jgi:hypothetical protein